MQKENTMNDSSTTSPQPASTIPPDDPQRNLAIARPNEDQNLPHIGLVGDTYTILLTGKDTAGRYCLIDMHVPPGGGPAPHRHDFDEMFTLLDGEIEFTFRGEKSVVRAGETVNIPANAPHFFQNASERPVRLLCMCSPAGLEEFFMKVGVPVASRTAPPPKLDEAAQAAFKAKAEALAPRYRTQILKPVESSQPSRE
jgi:quercetin dioxygenase-like cupin family protein